MKPYEFITMLCVVVATGLGIVTMVGNDIERVESDLAKLDETVKTLDGRVTVLGNKFTALEETVTALDGRVARLDETVGVLNTDFADLKGTVEKQADTLENLSNLYGAPFLTLSSGGDSDFTFVGRGGSGPSGSDRVWEPILDRLKEDGYQIETFNSMTGFPPQ